MIEVCAAIIQREGKVLIAQRGRDKALAYKWEFPGGKVEENESEKKCLQREIKEELNLEIEVHDKLDTIVFDYPDFSVRLTAYFASWRSGDLILHEHEDVCWVSPSELVNIDLAPADIPFVSMLCDNKQLY